MEVSIDAASLVTVASFLSVSAQRRRSEAEDVQDAKKLLGLADPTGEAYRSDAVHPLYVQGQIHPDNEAALKSVASDKLIRKHEVRDKLHVDAAKRSLLLFGSPTSEGLSRILFGYEEIAGMEGLLWRDPPVDLGYTWELDPSQLDDRSEIGRYVPGKGVVKRPTWQINDLRGRKLKRLTPAKDAEGLLASDYLLVTRVPNFLSREALKEGKFLVSFGGAHGTGTRAVERLLRDRKELTRALEALKSDHRAQTGQYGGTPTAYQLLFAVSDIRRSARGSSVAHAIELVDGFILDNSVAAWDEARRKVAPRLEAWQRERGDAAPES